jgi:hypothetical protein
MKILLTGSNGMVGRNIIDRRNSFLCDLLTPSSRELNLLNYNEVDNYLSSNKPDMIIHAAGKVGGIQANIANPINFLVENVDMGRNIIIAAKNNNIKHTPNNYCYISYYMNYYSIFDIASIISIWKNNYENHVSSVREYFANRPNDLIEYDIEKDSLDKLKSFFKIHNIHFNTDIFPLINKSQ